MTGATTLGVSAAEMPEMRIFFEGSLSRGMDYVNGSMQLTDTNGDVVELPAKFKTRGATASHYIMKPSLNMKLRTPDYEEEADSALLGMRSCSSWILDAMAIDCICMRNRVAFDIWNDFSRLPYDTDFDGKNGTEGRFSEMDDYFDIDGGEEGVEALKAKGMTKKGDGAGRVYNMAGQLVNAGTLPKGLYITGGKKYVVQ